MYQARRLCLLLTAALLASGIAFAGNQNTKSLGDAIDHALVQSKLTAPASTPFHLKARIVETTNPDSGYQGEIEEYWVSPEKWRRELKSPDFSQTLIVNGSAISETNTGDYYPWWLRNLVNAIFDPLPTADRVRSLPARLSQPSAGNLAPACVRLQAKIGVPPVENSAFYVYCFEGGHGLLDYAVSPEFSAVFRKYKPFKNKRISRLIEDDPEPGTHLQATVTELIELKHPSESMFVVQQTTPEAQRLKTVRIGEDRLRTMLEESQEILWPDIHDGKTKGVLSVYVSLDTHGQVREAWPLNSDNAGLNDSAREQVRMWRFKPAVMDGAPVQIESTLTFAFDVNVSNPIPVLTDSEARALASKKVEAKAPPGTSSGTGFTIRISVDENGKMIGAGNINNLPTPLFLAAYRSALKWKFRPFIRDGAPSRFHADITFRSH